MITPEYLNKVVQKVESQVSWLNMYLIKRMAKGIVVAFNTMQDKSMFPSTISDYHKLISAGMTQNEIEQALIKETPQLKKEIKQAFIDSADEIAKYNRHEEKKFLEIDGAKASELPSDKAFAKVAKEHNMTKEEVIALEEAYQRTNGTLKNYTKTTAVQTQKDYLKVCDEAYMKVKSGVSLNTACVEAIDALAKAGIHTVSYGNRVETIETAVTRAVRTGINQANSEIVLRRCSELGTAYVKISSHLGARVTNNNDFTNHSWWQGKIYHLDWNNPKLSKYKADNHQNTDTENKYPDFVESTGFGHILGLCGINCRHTFYRYNPDVQDGREDTFDIEENEKRYKAEQQARAMERKIREYKRRIEALKEYDDEESKVKRQELNSKLRQSTEAYMQFCNNNGLKPNNMRMQVGKSSGQPKPINLDYSSIDKKAKASQIRDNYDKFTDDKGEHNIWGYYDESALDNNKPSKDYSKVDMDKLFEPNDLFEDAFYDDDDEYEFSEKRLHINNPLNENATFDYELPSISEACRKSISEFSKYIVKEGKATNREYAVALNLITGNAIYSEMGKANDCISDSFKALLRSFPKNSVIIVHNHTNDLGFSIDDLYSTTIYNSMYGMIASCNDGSMYYMLNQKKKPKINVYNSFNDLKFEQKQELIVKSGRYDILKLDIFEIEKYAQELYVEEKEKELFEWSGKFMMDN